MKYIPNNINIMLARRVLIIRLVPIKVRKLEILRYQSALKSKEFKDRDELII
jgi:hypothetical protein